MTHNNGEHLKETDIGGVIVLKNIRKQFGEKVVLDGISLNIEKGKTTVVIGPSGCGKTVLIKHLIVLLRPDEGEVYFDGQRIDHLSEDKLRGIRTRYGFLFQGGALFDSMDVSENILFPIRHHMGKIDPGKAHRIVQNKLAMVGLEGYQGYPPVSLSGGQKKRVALARAIALNPRVVLYDEPTTGLDPIRSDVINELILKLQRELNVTSIVVTHDMTSAYKIADRIIMLHNGHIIADGSTDHIRSHPNQIVQQFIHGQADEADLAVLRMNSGSRDIQYTPEDFHRD
ncbi:MAG: ABC transporter ATP-binding protein [Phycisphaerae bacterium]|nr:ABC transporter ATP-binding protein [Phycisphaerae bacterium]